MQGDAGLHSNFGQPVVSATVAGVYSAEKREELITPAQASCRFEIPEYLLRKACAEGRLRHHRVVNALWLAPADIAAFADVLHGGKRGEPLD